MAELLKQCELAKRWNCSAGTILYRRKAGLIPYIELPGGLIRYPLQEVIRLERDGLRGSQACLKRLEA